MRYHRFWFTVFVLIVIGLFVVACGGPAPEPTKPSAPVVTTAPTAGATTAAVVPPSGDTAERRVRKLVLLTRPQGDAPDEFEITKLIGAEMTKLGFDVEVRAQPWEQLSDFVWYNRDKWDATAWRMVGRPERLDPDEFVFNLFHSSTAKDGFNFEGYNNPEYDKLAEAQRAEVDKAKRQQLIYQAQAIIARDQPYVFWTNPLSAYAYNNTVWETSSIVEQNGIGIKNFWTFIQATPKGSQKNMVLNHSSVVKAVNPLFISGEVDSWITELIWDRLMRVDPKGLPQPWAAEKVAWKDGTTVEVTIRQGMKWHDGKPVTLDDVIFSFQAPSGDKVPMYKPFVGNIANITKTSDNVLTFKLAKASAAFETATLAKVNLVPKHIWEPLLQDLANKKENAESIQEKTPIGSGPFKFVQWKPSEEVTLEANKDHWAAPKMNRWVLRTIPTQEGALGAFRSGELNFLANFSGDPELLKQLVAADNRLAMVATTDVGMRFLAFNNRRPPFDDPAVRQAVAMVTNKDTIIKNIYKSFASPADSQVSTALPYWHNPNLTQYPYNVQAARDLLAKAGYEWDANGKLLYPKGKKETLTPQ